MKDKVSNSNFIQHLSRIASAIIGDTFSEKMADRGFVPTRQLKPDEEYARLVLLAAGELMTVCRQLHQSVSFLAGFRSTNAIKTKGINRLDYILYHLENHLIRTTTVFDRGLLLVNEVFQLGNEPENCKPHIILTNQYVLRSPAISPLKELDKHLKPYRGPRNLVMHRQRYEHKDLYWIECMYILQEEPNDVVRPNLLKTLTDVFVKERKEEMIKFNAGLTVIVLKLFEALEVEFQKRHTNLQAEGLV